VDTGTLLTTEQHGDVVATVLDNNESMDEPTAVRIVDEALKWVAACAQFPTARIAPSRVVDEGWHALILHTALYAQMCEQLGGFVHHYPERPDPGRWDPQVIDRTTSLIEEAGHSVDYDLWTAPDKQLVSVAADCQHSDDGGPIVTQPKPKG
jgi:hypothetical protein